jgi:hypothetical protein
MAIEDKSSTEDTFGHLAMRERQEPEDLRYGYGDPKEAYEWGCGA